MDYPLIKPEYYYSLFKDIVNFLKSPHNIPNKEKSKRIKIYDSIGLYILKFIFLTPVVLFFAFVYDPPNVQSVSMSERFSPIALLLVGGIILPFIEEIGFRLSLKFKPIYLTLSSTVFMYYILTKVIFQTNISLIDESFTTRLLASVLFGVALYPVLNIGAIKVKLTLFWNAYFPFIFYITCIIFAWMHITKYEFILINILLLPILTTPQLLSAIIYGYTRVNFGFLYPLILHMAMNLISISLSFLPFSD